MKIADKPVNVSRKKDTSKPVDIPEMGRKTNPLIPPLLTQLRQQGAMLQVRDGKLVIKQDEKRPLSLNVVAAVRVLKEELIAHIRYQWAMEQMEPRLTGMMGSLQDMEQRAIPSRSKAVQQYGFELLLLQYERLMDLAA